MDCQTIQISSRPGEPLGLRNLKMFPTVSKSKSKPQLFQHASNLMSEVYDEFAEESSIHGIRYTSGKKSPRERAVWLLLVVLSMISAGMLAQKFYHRHKEATMRTLIVTNHYPSHKIPLPAVTICHPTIVSTRKLEQYEKDGKRIEMPFGMEWNQFLSDLQFTQEIYVPTNHFQHAMFRLNSVMSYNNLSMEGLLSILSPSCDEYLAHCQLQGESKSCHHYIKPSKTIYGLCCSFNYVYAERDTRWSQGEDIYSNFFGDNFIFSAIVKNFGDLDRIAALTYGDGTRVLIHDSHSYPGQSSREFIARQGSETIAYVDGRILTASPEVLNLPRDERDCRTTMAGGSTYRLDNCIAICHEKLLKEYCDCIPYYASVFKDDDIACNFTHISCLSKVKARVLQTPFRNEPCNCYPVCDGNSYLVAITAAPMNAAQHNPSSFYRIAENYPNSTAIHITFPRQTATLLRRDLVLSWINLVSSLGGVFSLFLGCSFISLCEMIYFLMYYVYRVIKGRVTNS
ncbi:sodium channel protein Nach-like [Fopius arisanus]|uniref:Sodium channel protein Nach-like n=1 Tax=Fopius arisanus TaxID=64838 RepID=A0A9R1TAN7_9HYME|nr:PREDICTED: sodium channel protein Nach-like [Fopius arisanus]